MPNYHCIMSHYPLHIDVSWVCGHDFNTDFWEEWISFKTEEEFENWVANHPYQWNVVQVETKRGDIRSTTTG